MMQRSLTRMFPGLWAVIAALVLAACAAPTPYGPAPGASGDRGEGYWQQAIEGDRVRVTFAGNTRTSRETVEAYVLYRAAEIALEHGGDHFIVADRATDKTTTRHTTYDYDGPFGFGFGPDFGFGYGNWPYGFRSAQWGYPFGARAEATTWTADRYTAHAEIVIGRGPKPDRPEAYDARAVIDRLGPGIIRSAR